MKGDDQLSLFSTSQLNEITPTQSETMLSTIAKISALLESVPDSQAKKVALSKKQLPSLLTSDQVFLSGKMLREHSPQMLAQTFGRLSKRLPTLGVIDLNFNCLIQSGYCPRIESGYTLLDILQDEVSQEYFLSQKMIFYLQKKGNKPKSAEPLQEGEIQEDCIPI